MSEIWKVIPNTNSDYEISNFGRIRSKRGIGGTEKKKDFKILAPWIAPNGYKYIYIRFNNTTKRRKVTIHSLVANAFLPIIKGKTEINHIDSNRTNNNVDNLEWVTSSENTEHAIKQGNLIPWGNRRKPIISIDTVTGKVKYWKSISEAEKFFNSRHITDVLKGRRKQIKHNTFQYLKEGDLDVSRYFNNG